MLNDEFISDYRTWGATPRTPKEGVAASKPEAVAETILPMTNRRIMAVFSAVVSRSCYGDGSEFFPAFTPPVG